MLKKSWTSWIAPVLLLVGGGLVAVLWQIHIGLNDHAVIPGRIYRSAQPSGMQLGELIRKHGLRTVLNLRGQATWEQWYRDDCNATAAAGINQEDVTLSAHTLPFPGELLKAVEVLDRAEPPVLIHCAQGADRTGLLSAIALLLYTDATLGEARRELWPNRGHYRVARTAAMDEFLDHYEEWLEVQREPHAPARFRHWLTTEYRQITPRSELTWQAAPPRVVSAGTPFGVPVRSTNRSGTPWPTRAGTFAGIHICYTVFDAHMQTVWAGRTGLRDGQVAPGDSLPGVALVKGLPPGRYTLVVETHDARRASIPYRTQAFTKYGDDSLLHEFTVNSN